MKYFSSVETLESRIAPASLGFNPTTGKLTITADGGDQIAIDSATMGDVTTYTVAGLGSFDNVRSISIESGGGDDSVLLGSNGGLSLPGSFTFTGGAGHDSLSFGAVTIKGAVTAKLGAGDDTISFSDAASFGKTLFDLGASDTGNRISNTNSPKLVFSNSLTILAAAGSDHINLSGPAMTLSVAKALTVNTGPGLDVNGADEFTLDLASISVGGKLSVASSDHLVGFRTSIVAADSAIISGGVVANMASKGSNFFQLDSSLLAVSGGISYVGGAESDSFILIAGRGTIIGNITVDNKGTSDPINFANYSTVQGGDLNVQGSLTFTGTDGKDTLDIEAAKVGKITASFGKGESSVTLSGLTVEGLLVTASEPVGASAAVDSFNVTDVTFKGPVSINLGGGASTVEMNQINAFAAFSLNTGKGADSIKLESAGLAGPSVFFKPLQINAGAGADSIAIGTAGDPDARVFFLAGLVLDAGLLDSGDLINGTSTLADASAALKAANVFPNGSGPVIHNFAH